MSGQNSKYDNHLFWERAICGKDLWRSGLACPSPACRPLFVNAAAVDTCRGTVDNNWACYPDAKALLGFVSYVFLPSVFYYVIHRNETDQLLQFFKSTEDFSRDIGESGSPYREKMLHFASRLAELWALPAGECLARLRAFCEDFNRFWGGETLLLSLKIFSDTGEIFDFAKKRIVFDEVCREDCGLDFEELAAFCEAFYTQRLPRALFVSFLNNRLGCLI